MKRQPKLTDRNGNMIPRVPSFAALDPRIRKAILKEADRYGVSVSFVIANALAFTFDINLDYTYKRRRRAR